MEKQNFIIAAKEKLTNFRIQYKMAGMKAKNSLNVTKQKELQNRLDKDYLIKDIKVKKLAIKLDNSVRFKGIIYFLLSVLSTLSSISLSVLGITNTSNFYELLENNKLIVYATLICLLQVAVWLISFNNNYIKDKFNSHYFALCLLQKSLIGISMIGNYLFLTRLLDAKGVFDYIFITVCSISLDIVANKFSSLSMDCFYLNYSYSTDSNDELDADNSKNLFDMFLFIITYKIRIWIKEKYIQRVCDYKERLNKLNEYTPNKCTNNTSKINVKAINNLKSNVSTSSDYNTVKAKLLTLDNDTMIGAKVLGISSSDWRKTREKLLADGLIYSLGTKSYKKNLLA